MGFLPGHALSRKHGQWSVQIRKRYSDARTTEGRRLKEIMKGLREDFGDGNLPAYAQLILDSIKAKIIVLLQISAYADKQIDLIDQNTGELLPCLGKNFTTYTESLRRDLEALAAMAGKKKGTSYKDMMKQIEGTEK